MSQAKDIQTELKDLKKRVNLSKVHPEDRLNLLFLCMDIFYPGDRMYEYLLEKGYEEDDEYEGPEAELSLW